MYRQLQAFFKIPNMDLKALDNVCQGSTEFCSGLLKTYEWRQLFAFLAVLEPFAKATLTTQGTTFTKKRIYNNVCFKCAWRKQ